MSMTQNGVLKKDDNDYPVMGGVSSIDLTTIVNSRINPSTGRLLVDSAGGTGITSINSDTTAAQTLAVGTAGTDFAIVDNGTGTHTFNLPTASHTNRGALSSADWDTFNAKGSGTVTTVSVATANGFAGSVATATTTPAITLTTSINSPVLAGNGTAISAATATGSTSTVVLQTSPTLITPVLGVATATSINKMAITAPATSSTLAVADGKTFTVSNSLTLVGTDSTTMTFPVSSTTVAGLGTTQSFTGTNTFKATIQTRTAMAAQALDGSLGNMFTRTLAGSETFTQSNFSTGQNFIVEVKQGSGTSYTVTWFSGVTWITSGATAPVQTTTTNGFTTYGFTCYGSNTFYGYLVGTQ